MSEENRDRQQLKKDCLRKCGILLAQRDYTLSRLREKLLSYGFDEETADRALEDLREARYLDDERYARNYVSAHWEDRSRLRIRMDLESRGVPPELASEVIRQELEERGAGAEILQIRKLMRKRGYDPGAVSWEDKSRMQAFLYRKGYSASSIRAAMNADLLDSDGFNV